MDEENKNFENMPQQPAETETAFEQLDDLQKEAIINELPPDDGIVADTTDVGGEGEISEAQQEIDIVSHSDTVKIMSPGRLVVKRFFRSKLSIVGLAGLIFLFAFAFIGPLFSPFGEIEVVGATRTVQTIFSYDVTDEVTGEVYTLYEVREAVVTNKTAPSAKNWRGTDTMGYDVLTRLMYGGRISLLLSFVVIFLEMLIGIVLGGLAGYFGKWVDQLVMRLVDILNCLPTLPILLISCSLLDSWGVPAESRIYFLMIILTIFGWGGTARLVRGQILMLREQEFMVAAEATGLSARRKIFKHLIPNVLPQLIVSATLGLGSVILYESTLSYFNLGVPFPYAAWGSMIGLASPSSGSGREILQYYPNLWVPAGVLIVMAVLCFNFVGAGLRDAFDPKSKK